MFGDIVEELGDVAEAVGDAAGAAMGAVAGPIIDAVADGCMREFIIPKAVEAVIVKMGEKYPQLNSMDNLVVECTQAATDSVMDYIEAIHTYCSDCSNPAETFHKVGVLLLRGLRRVCEAVVRKCIELVAGCFACICPCLSLMDRLYLSLVGIVDEVVNEMVEQIKDWMRGQLQSKGLPGGIIDVLDFAFNENDDIGRPSQTAPEPQVMGIGASCPGYVSCSNEDRKLLSYSATQTTGIGASCQVMSEPQVPGYVSYPDEEADPEEQHEDEEQ